MTPIQSELFALQDKKYRDFHAGLLPTVPKETIIGIRKPAIRGYARTLAGTPEAASFIYWAAASRWTAACWTA